MRLLLCLCLLLSGVLYSGCALIKDLSGKGTSYSFTFFAGKIVPGWDSSTGSPVFEVILGEGISDINTCLPDMEVESFTYQTSLWNSQNISEGHYVHMIGRRTVVQTDENGKPIETPVKIAFDSSGNISIPGGLVLPNGQVVKVLGKVPSGTKIKSITIGSDGKTTITAPSSIGDIPAEDTVDSGHK